MYDLPTSLEIAGQEYGIRSDYRAVLDLLTALAAPDLEQGEKALAALDIFYPDFLHIPAEDLEEALAKCTWFVNGGDEGDNRKRPKLMDWEQDFQYIVAPINRIFGKDVRSMPYVHWWTFLAAYREIGDCLFAQIIRIRNLKAKGKRLEKADQEFYRENKRLVDIQRKYTDADNDVLSQWI